MAMDAGSVCCCFQPADRSGPTPSAITDEMKSLLSLWRLEMALKILRLCCRVQTVGSQSYKTTSYEPKVMLFIKKVLWRPLSWVHIALHLLVSSIRRRVCAMCNPPPSQLIVLCLCPSEPLGVSNKSFGDGNYSWHFIGRGALCSAQVTESAITLGKVVRMHFSDSDVIHKDERKHEKWSTLTGFNASPRRVKTNFRVGDCTWRFRVSHKN